MANRDAVDERLVREYRDGTGKLVYDIKDVGGFPPMAKGTPYADADGDGMPDRWEKPRGLNPSVNDSAADRDGDGYTNIEEFLNGPTKNAAALPAKASGKSNGLRLIFREVSAPRDYGTASSTMSVQAIPSDAIVRLNLPLSRM